MSSETNIIIQQDFNFNYAGWTKVKAKNKVLRWLKRQNSCCQLIAWRNSRNWLIFYIDKIDVVTFYAWFKASGIPHDAVYCQNLYGEPMKEIKTEVILSIVED